MSDFEKPILTVDVVCFTLIEQELNVLLLNREHEPFMDYLGLPGGYIHTEEDADSFSAAKRVARDKLGIDVTYMEQLRTFSGKDRDPRGWSATIVYMAVIQPSKVKERAGFYPIVPHWVTAELAFDHNIILTEAIKRLRDKSSYSSLPLFLMEDTFTLNDLQIVYESMMQVSIDKATFRRKILEQGIVEPSGEILPTKLHRPAKLYRPTAATVKLFSSSI